jgi:Anti-sigma factor NepR
MFGHGCALCKPIRIRSLSLRNLSVIPEQTNREIVSSDCACARHGDCAQAVESKSGLCHDSLRGRAKGTILVAEGKFSKSPAVAGSPVSRTARNPASSSERDIGSALRAAYDSTVSEDIPPEMLDLLNKLR